jgi:adenylate kinase
LFIKFIVLIKLHDLNFKPFILKSEIEIIVKALAEKVKNDYQNETPVFVGVLNGAFVFASDFVRNYEGLCEVNFVKLQSYEGVNSKGNVETLLGLNTDITNKHVIVLEDIVDSGNSLEKIMSMFGSYKMKSLKIATLFFKPNAYKKEFPVHYVGKEISNEFIVGYGLDYNGLGRNLSDIYQLNIQD